MADIVAVKTINGKPITRTFNRIAWDSLGFNKQGWAEVNGMERLAADVPVSEKKNKAAAVKAAADVKEKTVEPEPEITTDVDGIPGITESETGVNESDETQPVIDETAAENTKQHKASKKRTGGRKHAKKAKK